MLIVMKPNATNDEVDLVLDRARSFGLVPHEIPGAHRTAIGITGNDGPVAPELFEGLDGIRALIPVTKRYKLVDREATGTAYRLIGVGVSNYAPLEEAAALDLADPDAGRRARLEDTIDTLRDKFGADAIGKGRGMAERLKTSETEQGKEP